MTVLVTVIVILVVLWAVRALHRLNIIKTVQAMPELKLERREGFDPAGNSRTMLHVAFFGSLYLPEAADIVIARIHISDVTDPEVVLPVRSVLEGASDDDGMFFWAIPFDIPNGTYLFRRQELCSFDLGGLHAPYTGGRRFEVRIEFSDSMYGETHSTAVQTFYFVEDKPGYLELQEKFDRVERSEQSLVDLFMSIETEIPIADIEACIAELHQVGSYGIAESAYERCLQAARELAALTAAQRSALDRIGQLLLLPTELVAELNDRYLRLSMMKGVSDLESLGIPEGMANEELLDYLAAEYRKWRGRATHSDRAISAEATARLEMIARVRATLR